ncbi:hypothetical protein P4V44_20060, partial [Brevibacillus agri]|nr:hypothetical protein [Brevibacillus agri]
CQAAFGTVPPFKKMGGHNLFSFSKCLDKGGHYIKAYANTVSSCRSSLITLGSTLLAELGVAVLTVETVIGTISAGGAAAITAREIYSQSTTAHEAMANAYSILENAY